ncbi:lysozyme inhibitor LprI family protein [Aurantibacter aestuarii]|uniref:DUF1311 domain-containing protein n=1 Tax=Aurantibacter aestuarii TaxID=1266046 RepID=A0A2T1N8F7_9FLAO|nr:lysozyme inhibitor LprI family protein [Aurantibacter aestuarii]PSG88157.1 DUF1311 domain-containing protein [Aurantibacter aestuarii]
MKQLIFIISLSFSLVSFSQTQMEMNQDAHLEYQKADKELNRVYQAILTEYKSEPLFIERLKVAQRLWINFRDAELDMRFPKTDKGYYYGSVYPMCVSLILKEMTEERTKKLMVWLDGIEEGEMCLGSIKMK